MEEKDVKNLYDYVETVRSEHLQTVSRISSLEAKVDNAISAISRIASSLEEQSKFPVATTLTGIGLVITIIVVLAGGYIGQPLSELRQSHSELYGSFTIHEEETAAINATQKAEIDQISKQIDRELEIVRLFQLQAAKESGIQETELDFLLKEVGEFKSRDYLELSTLSKQSNEKDSSQLQEIKDRLRSIESNRFTKEDARSLIKDILAK